MKKPIEFPIFEWIVVTIVLFVVVIFALPKLLDVGREARIKTLNTVTLNLGTVNQLLYSRAVIKNIQNVALQSSDILGGEDAGVFLVYGELRAHQYDIEKYITSPIIKFSQQSKPDEVRLYLENFKNDACYITYHQAVLVPDPDGQPSIKKAFFRVKSTGC